MTRLADKQKARELRAGGMSIGDISKFLGISKGSISPWVKDVQLTDEQRAILSSRIVDNRNCFAERFGGNSGQGAWNSKQKAKREIEFRTQASAEWESLRHNQMFVYALGLYVGEGRKNSNVFEITNCDPSVIITAMRFLTLLGVDGERIRLSAQVYENNNLDKAREFWVEHTGMTEVTIYPVSVTDTHGKAKVVRRVRPYGTAKLRVCSTELAVKVDEWMKLAAIEFS